MMNFDDGESHIVKFSPALPNQGAFFSDWIYKCHREMFAASIPLCVQHLGGSIWIEKQRSSNYWSFLLNNAKNTISQFLVNFVARFESVSEASTVPAAPAWAALRSLAAR